MNLPTRTGTPTGKAFERKMADKVPNDDFRTVIEKNPDGSDTMLRTRGGELEYSNSQANDIVPGSGSLLDFYSGAATYMDDVRGVFTPTVPCATRLGLGPGLWYGSDRLDVRCNDQFDATIYSDPPIHNQYEVVKPHFYTGHMRGLVQLVLGIGQPFVPSLFTRTHTKPPVRLPDRIRTMSVAGTPNLVSYDYRFSCSHGLFYDAGGEPWVIEISQSHGVRATILPREFGSRSWVGAFSFYVNDIRGSDPSLTITDPEMLGALTTFKGVPTGEHPDRFTNDFQDWVDAGLGFQLLAPEDMVSYTQCAGVSPQLGWAFDYLTSEARAVGHYNVTGPGVNYLEARYFGVKVSLPKAPATDTSDAVSSFVKQMLPLVISTPALRTKLEFVTAYHLPILQAATDKIQALSDLDIGLGSPSAIFSLISASPQVSNGNFLKVWNPAIQLCAGINLQSPSGMPAADDSMVSVHYGNDGTLVELKYGGTNPSGPYCSVYDPREGGFGSRTTDLGTTSETGNIHEVSVGVSPSTDMAEWYVRTWWVRTQHKTLTESGRTTWASAFIPEGDRESIVLARLYEQSNANLNVSGNIGSAGDAYAYHVSPTDLIGVNGAEVPNDGSTDPDGCAFVWNRDPPVVRSNPVINYAGINTGEWAKVCSFARSMPGQPDKWNGDTGSGITYFGSSTSFTAVVVFGSAVETLIADSAGGYYVFGIWFKLSSPSSDPQTLRTASSCLGPNMARQVYDDINSGEYKMFGTVLSTVLERINPCYVGWV